MAPAGTMRWISSRFREALSTTSPSRLAAAEQAGKQFDVVLFGYHHTNKIHVIKGAREVTHHGLFVTKSMCEILPACILAGSPRQKAEEARRALERAVAERALERMLKEKFC